MRERTHALMLGIIESEIQFWASVKRHAMSAED